MANDDDLASLDEGVPAWNRRRKEEASFLPNFHGADLAELLRDYRTDLLTCALTFAATCSGADHVVLGVDSSEQLRQASRSTKADLPAGLARELDRRFADVPSRVIDPRQWGDRAS